MPTVNELQRLAERKGIVDVGGMYKIDEEHLYAVLEITKNSDGSFDTAYYQAGTSSTPMMRYFGEFSPQGEYRNSNARRTIEAISQLPDNPESSEEI